MGRALIGAVAGAVAMFIIGFIFFATPLHKIGLAGLTNDQAAAVQHALAANVPGTGTYAVPDGSTSEQTTMYGKGPIAVVHYNSGGFAVADPAVMIGGFIHMLIVAALMAYGLLLLSRHVTDTAEQFKLLGIAVLASTIYMHLGDPIWFHFDWAYAIYGFIADSISLGAAGFIILKLLPRAGSAAAAEPPVSTVH